MIWFKKRDPASQWMPITDLQGGETVFGGDMWIYPSAGQLEFYIPGPSGHLWTSANVLYQTNWNNMAMRGSNNQYSGEVNGTQIVSNSISANQYFGNRMNISSRMFIGDLLDDYLWNGCLGHFIFFNKTLSNEVLTSWSSMVADNKY
jgi:hypothetical protein